MIISSSKVFPTDRYWWITMCGDEFFGFGVRGSLCFARTSLDLLPLLDFLIDEMLKEDCDVG